MEGSQQHMRHGGRAHRGEGKRPESRGITHATSTRRPALLVVAMLAALTFATTGCEVGPVGSMGVSSGANMGATAGGAQDLSYARSAIERGEVPEADWILTEGLFSEHDLSLEGAPAEHLLSLNLGSGVVRDASGQGHYIVQVGMSSNIQPDQFKRPPLNISLVLDLSGSMDGDKIAAARRAASTIVRQMTAEDVLSIVTFNQDSRVLVSARNVEDDRAFEKAISSIEASGSTNMEAGLRDGIAQVSRNLDLKSHEHRVILITDALPNTGRHHEDDFLRLTENASAKGIGLTAFGVGMDFGISLATSISNIRGGNCRFLRNASDLGKVFDEEFETLMTPLAYDLRLEMRAAPGFRITAVHGVPGWNRGDSLASAEVKSVFVSKRGGAIAFELARISDGFEPAARRGTPVDIANVSLKYSEITGKNVSQQGTATLPEDAETSDAWFSHGGVAKTAALAFACEGMRRACDTFHSGNRIDALDHLSGLPELIEKAANRTNDSNLAKEANLVVKLRAAIERQTGQATRWDNQRRDDSDFRARARESVPSKEEERREMPSSVGRAVRW